MSIGILVLFSVWLALFISIAWGFLARVRHSRRVHAQATRCVEALRAQRRVLDCLQCPERATCAEAHLPNHSPWPEDDCPLRSRGA
ncbi:hypothetical protein [Thioalkalivibrio thiocyanodenitrificans]|uniref:hypothetical protein n=1 Tax=Thioalkalivibrio thiocyanodenitrificans TaxID=243063 RepID=UPI000372BAB5|nr:hypothetical protein [Thioalkalivibrio thiocyanodenitrificans]